MNGHTNSVKNEAICMTDTQKDYLQHFTSGGKERCIFEMYYRYASNVIRKPGVPEACSRRGDKQFPGKPPITDPGEMLKGIIQYLDGYKTVWKYADILDNRLGGSRDNRKIFVWKNGVVVLNKLDLYHLLLATINYTVPEWMDADSEIKK